MDSPLGLSLDDRALALAVDGRVLSVAPSIVRREGENVIGVPAAGLLRSRPAEVSARHWSDIAGERATSAAARSLAAAEVRARLRAAGAGADGAGADGEGADGEGAGYSGAWIAASAVYTPRALSEILAVMEAASLPVRGFVDAAVATVAPLGLAKPAIVLEMGLSHVAATAVECGPVVRRRRSLVSGGGGLLDIYQSWLDVVSAAMVLRTRFDPLHDAAVEQRLFDDLPALAAQAAELGAATVALEGPTGERHEVAIARDQLAAAAAPRYRELERCLHELRRAGAPVAVVVPAALLGLAGLRERLETLSDCELIAVPEGWAAAVASQLPVDEAAGAHVRLLRRLAATATLPGGEAPRRERLGAGRREGLDPTHVLYAGRALPLTPRGLTVGREGNGADITVSAGAAGVSRRHCTLLRGADGVVLVDHSRYGTWVNDERVAGRTLLAAGDQVRLGEPRIELALISVGGGHAQASPD
ncbi:MAG: FHA domain-containing protein [Steroidobacteraceae bacterium]